MSVKLQFKKCVDNAIIPTKAYPSDTGYDLSIITIEKIITTMSGNNEIITYDTGIAVACTEGYYTEVVPRSSFSKTGYMLANSVGIIDASYRGSIKIVITGDKQLPTLQLPFKGFQLIIRKRVDAEVEVVDELDETVRGDGGFGSTDLKLNGGFEPTDSKLNGGFEPTDSKLELKDSKLELTDSKLEPKVGDIVNILTSDNSYFNNNKKNISVNLIDFGISGCVCTLESNILSSIRENTCYKAVITEILHNNITGRPKFTPSIYLSINKVDQTTGMLIDNGEMEVNSYIIRKLFIEKKMMK